MPNPYQGLPSNQLNRALLQTNFGQIHRQTYRQTDTNKNLIAVIFTNICGEDIIGLISNLVFVLMMRNFFKFVFQRMAFRSQRRWGQNIYITKTQRKNPSFLRGELFGTHWLLIRGASLGITALLAVCISKSLFSLFKIPSQVK